MTDTRHRQGDAEAAAVQKTPNRVTLDHILSLIVAEEFIHPGCAPHVTLCVLKLKNGFTVTGKSAPADPLNFNAELGQKIARDQAIAEIWALEGYVLRERISAEG